MAISFIKERKKQKYLIFIIGGVLVITGFVLWFGYFRKEKTLSSPSPLPPIEADYYRKIRINFEVLKSPFLKESRPFEKIPPFEDGKGRENPFLPY